MAATIQVQPLALALLAVIKTITARVAQLEEPRFSRSVAAGSSPVVCYLLASCKMLARVAQLEEHWFTEPKVAGSSPVTCYRVHSLMVEFLASTQKTRIQFPVVAKDANVSQDICLYGIMVNTPLSSRGVPSSILGRGISAYSSMEEYLATTQDTRVQSPVVAK